MVIGGLGLLLWALLVWQWEDPFTGLYTRYKQHQLASTYESRLADFRPRLAQAVSLADARRQIAREARRYRLSARPGEAIARITIPRLGLEAIVVNGTDSASLKRGRGEICARSCPARASSSTSQATGRRTAPMPSPLLCEPPL